MSSDQDAQSVAKTMDSTTDNEVSRERIEEFAEEALERTADAPIQAFRLTLAQNETRQRIREEMRDRKPADGEE